MTNVDPASTTMLKGILGIGGYTMYAVADLVTMNTVVDGLLKVGGVLIMILTAYGLWLDAKHKKQRNQRNAEFCEQCKASVIREHARLNETK